MGKPSGVPRFAAAAMRVSDRGSGRSGAIGDAADMAIPDQPSVTVTTQLLTERAWRTAYVLARAPGSDWSRRLSSIVYRAHFTFSRV